MRIGALALTALLFVLGAASAAPRPSEDAVRRNNGGAELLKQGKLTEAIAEFRQAVTVDPTYGAAWRNLGFALDKQGQVDEAVTAYQQAVALEPEVNAYNNLGVLYDKQGRTDQAIREF